MLGLIRAAWGVVGVVAQCEIQRFNPLVLTSSSSVCVGSVLLVAVVSCS